MESSQKKFFFMKLIYLISRVFLAWIFFNFLAHSVLTTTNSCCLTDPLAITWYLASNEAIFGGGGGCHHQAQIFQWDFFAQSGIRPYLHGYIQAHIMNRRVLHEHIFRL